MKRWKLASAETAAFVIASCLTVASGGSKWTLGLGGDAFADITVTKARIGCLDIQQDGNLTGLVGQACDHKMSCSYKAPTEDEYKRAGVHAATRTFCTQAMEITYSCGSGGTKMVTVPGDAWKHPAAELRCDPPPPTPHVDTIHVSRARIGCLDIQRDGNLTGMVAQSCNNLKTCSFKAPTEDQYRRAGVSAATRTFCTQAMEITYDCGRNDPQTILVPGNAWDQPAAELSCNPKPVAPSSLPFGQAPIAVTKARIGCLDIQQDGNLTSVVAHDCNGRPDCTYKAPTPDAYTRLGVHAATRIACRQAMEIIYRCGNQGDAKTIVVPGDAWNHPAAHLICDGATVATNIERVSGLPDEPCESGWPSKYVLAPPDMLDWKPLDADTLPILNHPPPPATRAMYNTTSNRAGAPGSTIGASEGRLIEPLRKAAARHDAMADLCDAAKAFTGAGAGGPQPAMGNAMADLAVTGTHTFARFRRDNPTLESLKRACPGVADASLNRALNRAYAVGNAIRVRGTDAQPTTERKGLGWIAISGEDDRPYRPVNVPTAAFPQFDVDVDVRGMAMTLNSIHTRYMIAHARPPQFRPGPVLAHGGTREVKGDVEPAIAPDAHVIIFVHGMDSRVEEALNLTQALHQLARQPGGKNWTIISFDMPTSGYADSIDHDLFGPAGDVTCHRTPLVDFLENYVVKFVDAVDARVGGHLKPRIRAVIGGSLGGSMSLRLGRREALGTQPPAPWIHNVVPWSPASIWPPITNRGGVMAGCDAGWDAKNDIAIGWPRGMAEVNERPNDRRNFFYAAFDYNPPSQRAQALYWYRDDWTCKSSNLVGARVDRQETYDPLFRRYHFRLAAEQLAFSHRQNRGPDATRPSLSDPLFLYNKTRALLIAGEEDTGGDLGAWTNKTAPLMTNTPGLFRFLAHTGHSLDDERPMWVAKEIVNFLAGDPHAPD
jgi:hypothetical protein